MSKDRNYEELAEAEREAGLEQDGWKVPQKSKFDWKKELWEWVKIIV